MPPMIKVSMILKGWLAGWLVVICNRRIMLVMIDRI